MEENKFNIGDKVKVINAHDDHYNDEGIIIAVNHRSISGYNYIVNIRISCQPMFYEKELILI
jgi:hypothetical protein